MLVAEVSCTLHGKVNQVSTWQLARNPKINTPLKPVIVYMDNPTEARAENKGEDQGPSHVFPPWGQLVPVGWRAAFQWANRLEMGPTMLQLSPAKEN